MKDLLKVGGMHCRRCETVVKLAVEDVVCASVVQVGRGFVEFEAGCGACLQHVAEAITAEGFSVA